MCWIFKHPNKANHQQHVHSLRGYNISHVVSINGKCATEIYFSPVLSLSVFLWRPTDETAEPWLRFVQERDKLFTHHHGPSFLFLWSPFLMHKHTLFEGETHFQEAFILITKWFDDERDTGCLNSVCLQIDYSGLMLTPSPAPPLSSPLTRPAPASDCFSHSLMTFVQSRNLCVIVYYPQVPGSHYLNTEHSWSFRETWDVCLSTILIS